MPLQGETGTCCRLLFQAPIALLLSAEFSPLIHSRVAEHFAATPLNSSQMMNMSATTTIIRFFHIDNQLC